MTTRLKDIAQKSGYSISIVSRVLNSKGAKYRISKETERKVLQTARELNYRPNQLARGLRLKKTHTIGLVAPDLANPFFASIIKTVQSVAHVAGYSLIVCDTDEDSDLEIEHVNLLRGKGVDGLIVMPVGQEGAHLQALVESRIPLVVVDRVFAGLETHSVVVDNYGGAFEAVEYLISHGHTRIAIIQGLPNTYTASERLRGYRDAFARYELPIDESLIVGKDFRKQNGYVETKFLLGRPDPPSAIFSTSDLITLGVLEAVSEEGVRIPEDLSIIAFDDIEPAALYRCPITAVAQPKENIGEFAVKMLIEQLTSHTERGARQLVLKPTLVVRDSVAFLRREAPGLGINRHSPTIQH